MNRPAQRRSDRGASLLAAIVLIILIGFFGAIAMNLTGTQNSSALNETQSSQALYIAEGGLEFANRSLAQNLDFYRSTADPIALPATTLGNGSFVVNAFLPVTLLRTRIPNGTSTNPIRVYATARFPTSGYLQIDDNLGGAGEFIQYTGIAADTFTGVSRDRTINGINGAGTSHERSSRVYPVTTLSTALLNNIGGTSCVPTTMATSIGIAAHPKFLPAGTISIASSADPTDPEEIGYAGSTTSGGVITLSGVVRCLNGTSSAHSVGDPVTSVLVDGGGPDYEASVLSTGTVTIAGLSSAVRAVRKTVQR